MSKPVVMVAAVAENGVIGKGGDIPWHLSDDLKHFRATTRGNTVVMGRTTYEGIGHPLPYRTNVVVTRDPSWRADGVFVAPGVEQAIAMAQDFEGDVMIGGGTQVYAAAMPYATHQVLTEVRLSPEGDTFYPDWDRSQWRETRREDREGFSWVWWERIGAPPR
jgi:dihydrofolate reductase